MDNIFRDKKIIIGITGSISAYKTPMLVRELIKKGAIINVVMTPSAAQFVTPLTMENLSRNPVHIDMFDKSLQTSGAWHIHLVHDCDAMMIAPCSCTTLGKIANGICDNALVALSIALPREKPLLIAPAMDSSMFLHPSTQINLEKLREFGAIIIPPDEGDLSSGLEGPGRLPEIDDLIKHLHDALSGKKDNPEKKYQYFNYKNYEQKSPQVRNDLNDEAIRNSLETPVMSLNDAVEKDRFTAELELELLKKSSFDKYGYEKYFLGKKVLISAGPTHEKIDDVRYITNYSSGKMGFALAKFAAEAGADVVLVAGPVNLETPAGVKRIDVTTADEMFDVSFQEFHKCDIAILSAAVADYTPINPVQGKIKKAVTGDRLVLELQTTNDILATLGSEKSDDQLLIGFALESSNEIENGWSKLKSKNCDMIVVNSLNKPKSGFMGDDNTITILSKSGKEESLPPMSKIACSRFILSRIADMLKDEIL